MMNNTLLRHRGVLGFLQVLSSNCVLILLGVISSFIVPMSVSPTEFGYWQTYLLYDAYVGLALFGYCDGIYLRFGGQDYGGLPKGLFSALFMVMLLYLIVIALCLSCIIFASDTTPKNRYIFYAVVISMVLRCTISFFVLINQATARFKIYSIGNTIEKIFFVCAVVAVTCYGRLSMYNLIIVSISGQLLALAYNLFTSRALFTLQVLTSTLLWSEIKANIAAGLPLTMSAIASMLMTGVGKFSVEHYLGKEQFGYYSFAFPMMALVTQVISAASLVLFPLLKQADDRRNVEKLLNLADKWSLLGFAAVMAMYIPASVFVNLFLPAYKPTLPCLLILLPMLYFQAKITMVYNTVLKIEGRSNVMMRASITSLVFCFASTVLLLNISPSLTAVACCTTASYVLWQILLKRSLKPSYSNPNLL